MASWLSLSTRLREDGEGIKSDSYCHQRSFLEKILSGKPRIRTRIYKLGAKIIPIMPQSFGNLRECIKSQNPISIFKAMHPAHATIGLVGDKEIKLNGMANRICKWNLWWGGQQRALNGAALPDRYRELLCKSQSARTGKHINCEERIGESGRQASTSYSSNWHIWFQLTYDIDPNAPDSHPG